MGRAHVNMNRPSRWGRPTGQHGRPVPTWRFQCQHGRAMLKPGRLMNFVPRGVSPWGRLTWGLGGPP
eukprot:5395401-Prymnesium_polylepis.1